MCRVLTLGDNDVRESVQLALPNQLLKSRHLNYPCILHWNRYHNFFKAYKDNIVDKATGVVIDCG